MTNLELDDAARRIAHRAAESDVSIEEVLARIALEAVGEEPLLDARDKEGVQLGPIGVHGHRLRKRVDAALSGIEHTLI